MAAEYANRVKYCHLTVSSLIPNWRQHVFLCKYGSNLMRYVVQYQLNSIAIRCPIIHAYCANTVAILCFNGSISDCEKDEFFIYFFIFGGTLGFLFLFYLFLFYLSIKVTIPTGFERGSTYEITNFILLSQKAYLQCPFTGSTIN